MKASKVSFNWFKSVKDKQSRGKVPGRRRGGARRGVQLETQGELVVIAAATEVETQTLLETYVGGVTTAERPTFWFDVPCRLTDDMTAEFILQDDQGEILYRVGSSNFADLARTPGVIGISLPNAIAPLETDKTYQWYFNLDCHSESPLSVQGGIERVPLDPTFADELASATPLEQAALYQENEVWYDAITALAQLRHKSDDPAVSAAWTDLLQALDL